MDNDSIKTRLDFHLPVTNAALLRNTVIKINRPSNYYYFHRIIIDFHTYRLIYEYIAKIKNSYVLHDWKQSSKNLYVITNVKK